jgi:hypothetical protein
MRARREVRPRFPMPRHLVKDWAVWLQLLCGAVIFTVWVGVILLVAG